MVDEVVVGVAVVVASGGAVAIAAAVVVVVIVAVATAVVVIAAAAAATAEQTISASGRSASVVPLGSPGSSPQAAVGAAGAATKRWPATGRSHGWKGSAGSP